MYLSTIRGKPLWPLSLLPFRRLLSCHRERSDVAIALISVRLPREGICDLAMTNYGETYNPQKDENIKDGLRRKQKWKTEEENWWENIHQYKEEFPYEPFLIVTRLFFPSPSTGEVKFQKPWFWLKISGMTGKRDCHVSETTNSTASTVIPECFYQNQIIEKTSYVFLPSSFRDSPTYFSSPRGERVRWGDFRNLFVENLLPWRAGEKKEGNSGFSKFPRCFCSLSRLK